MALQRVKARTSTSSKLMPIIIGLAALGLAAGGYWLLLMPKISLISSGGELDLVTLQQSADAEKASAAAVTAAASDYRAINPEIKDKVLAAVPPEKDIPGIIASLDALAQMHNIVIVNFDAVTDEKAPLPSGEKFVNITMNLAGADYDGFKTYLADLERSLRIFDLQSMVFAPNTATYSVTLRTYFLEAKGGSKRVDINVLERADFKGLKQYGDVPVKVMQTEKSAPFKSE